MNLGDVLPVAIAAIVAVALFFALTRLRLRAPEQRVATNVALYRQRRAELEAEGAAHGIDSGELEALARELDLALVDEVPEASAERSDDSHFPGALALAVAATVAALSIGLYQLWGEPNAPALLGAGDVVGRNASKAELETAAGQLAARVQRRSEDQDSWFYLGHTRFRLGDYDAAAGAFAEVNRLTGPTVEVDAYWAQSRYLSAGAEVDDQTRTIMNRVLEQNPNHPAMLEMAAMDAVKKGDLDGAASNLDRALGTMMHAERRAALDNLLGEVRARLDPERPHIEVEVALEEIEGAPPWLLVFARPVAGGPPRAVVRRPVKPRQTIVLDNASSMSPAFALADAGEVVVVARLSRTGTAAPAAGDWEAASDPVVAADIPRLTLSLQAPANAPNRTQASLPPGHPAIASQPTAAANGLTIDVELGVGVSVPGDTTVFVIARAPAQPGPPLAVKRLSARDLPRTVTLSDADAMMPGRVISNQPSVEVVARAALGGSAAAAVGDFESEAQIVSDLKADLHLVIDRRVGG